MEEQHRTHRILYLQNISTRLEQLVSEVELSVRNNRTDIMYTTQSIMRGLLNLMYNWHLADANATSNAFPGVDMVDIDNRIAVEITISNTITNVRHIVERFIDNQLDIHFDRLIVLIITTKPATYGMQKIQHNINNIFFPFDGERDIWNIPRLIKETENLTDLSHLADISDYLDARQNVSILPTYLLPFAPQASASFIPGSRKREMEMLRTQINLNNPVYLSGIAGIGKTELAIELAKHHAPSKGAYFLRYQLPPDEQGEAMRETILNAEFSGYKFRGSQDKDREQEYHERLTILRTEYQGALLIIDGFDWPGKAITELQSERSFKDLLETGVKLVITTRSTVKKPGLVVGPISIESLLRLIRHHYTDNSVSDDRLLTLIHEVEGHTMAVDLIAQTLEESQTKLTPEKLLAILRCGFQDCPHLPEIISDQNRYTKHGTLCHFFRDLIHPALITEYAETVLTHAALLPQDGLDAQRFRVCLPRNQWQALQYLISQNWIRQRQGLLYIPAVVRLACLSKEATIHTHCVPFLEILWNAFIPDKDSTAFAAQLASYFSMAANHPLLRNGALLMRAGKLWELAGNAQAALDQHLHALTELEKSIPPDHPDLAIAYNDAGRLSASLGEHQKSLEYRLKAEAIMVKLLPTESPDLANLYFDIATTYHLLGDCIMELDYHLKALNIRKRSLPANHPDLIQSNKLSNEAFRSLRRS